MIWFVPVILSHAGILTDLYFLLSWFILLDFKLDGVRFLLIRVFLSELPTILILFLQLLVHDGIIHKTFHVGGSIHAAETSSSKGRISTHEHLQTYLLTSLALISVLIITLLFVSRVLGSVDTEIMMQFGKCILHSNSRLGNLRLHQIRFEVVLALSDVMLSLLLVLRPVLFQ